MANYPNFRTSPTLINLLLILLVEISSTNAQNLPKLRCENLSKTKKKCGSGCTVLLGRKNMNVFETCENYCAEHNRFCKRAWGGSKKSCSQREKYDCNFKFSQQQAKNQANVLCKCSKNMKEKAQPLEMIEHFEGPSTKNALKEGTQPLEIIEHTEDPTTKNALCNNLTNVKKTCGDGCTVLVKPINNISFGTCRRYCGFHGRVCLGAWEERDNTCDPKRTFDCNFDFTKLTTDALCKCSVDKIKFNSRKGSPASRNEKNTEQLEHVSSNGLLANNTAQLVVGKNQTSLNLISKKNDEEFSSREDFCTDLTDRKKICPDGCTVLVSPKKKYSYGTCWNYCSSHGRVCLGAWDERNCDPTQAFGCDYYFDKSSPDMMCKCAEQQKPSYHGKAHVNYTNFSPQTKLEKDDLINKTDNIPSPQVKLCKNLGKVKKSCGDGCTVLVQAIKNSFRTCNEYCGLHGRKCLGSWEEESNSCIPRKTENCNYSFRGDALCKCSEYVDIPINFQEDINQKHTDKKDLKDDIIKDERNWRISFTKFFRDFFQASHTRSYFILMVTPFLTTLLFIIVAKSASQLFPYEHRTTATIFHGSTLSLEEKINFIESKLIIKVVTSVVDNSVLDSRGDCEEEDFVDAVSEIQDEVSKSSKKKCEDENSINLKNTSKHTNNDTDAQDIKSENSLVGVEIDLGCAEASEELTCSDLEEAEADLEYAQASEGVTPSKSDEAQARGCAQASEELTCSDLDEAEVDLECAQASEGMIPSENDEAQTRGCAQASEEVTCSDLDNAEVDLECAQASEGVTPSENDEAQASSRFAQASEESTPSENHEEQVRSRLAQASEGVTPSEHDEAQASSSLFECNIDESCDICLGNYEIGEEICWSLNEECVHAFHKECIIEWLLRNPKCPCCRREYIRK